MEISSLDLSKRLKFISIFIALYESFSNYVIDCPRQLFNSCIIIKSELKEDIKKQDEIFAKRTASTNYKFTKFTENGYTQWLSPEYDERIKSRIIKGQNRNKPNPLFNSFMFFVEEKVFEQNDFNKFLEIRNLRNNFVHQMSKLMLSPIPTEWKKMFQELIHMYIKMNNYWCVMFELSIAGDDIPHNLEIDFDNVITIDLYNLLLSIDILFGTKFVIEKQWKIFAGLYDGICLPLLKKNHNTPSNGQVENSHTN